MPGAEELVERRAAMEAAVRAFHERTSGANPYRLAGLLHEQVQTALFENNLDPLEGRSAVLARMRSPRGNVFRANVTSLEWLDEDTILASGYALYPLERGGWAEGRVWWLNEFREQLLWRVRGFRSQEDALRAHAAG